MNPSNSPKPQNLGRIYRPWIDEKITPTAVYGLGHSEEVVARALVEWSGPQPYIFTKCGLRSDGSGKIREVLKADSIRHECEESLRLTSQEKTEIEAPSELTV